MFVTIIITYFYVDLYYLHHDRLRTYEILVRVLENHLDDTVRLNLNLLVVGKVVSIFVFLLSLCCHPTFYKKIATLKKKNAGKYSCKLLIEREREIVEKKN